MAQIASIHSFRGGTGKSNITANLATLMAKRGKRVAIIDTDINSPGIHVIFGMDENSIGTALNDFLWGECEIKEAAYPIDLPGAQGQLFLVPSNPNSGEITKILREGYEVGLLIDGMRDLIDQLDLDWLFIDTHPGLNDETLLSITISDALFIVMRPDQQDYQGTGVTVEVARKLQVPRLNLILNKVPSVFDADDVKSVVEETYGADVAGVLKHADEMMVLSSAGLFVNEFPNHEITNTLESIAASLD